MKSRPIKTALEQLLLRIEEESKACAKKEIGSLVADRVRKNEPLVKRYATIRAELDRAGLDFDHAGKPTVPHNDKEAGAIHGRHNELLRKFRRLRETTIIRSAIASDEERSFLIRYFFDEVLKDYPSLAPVVGKFEPARNSKLETRN